MPPVFRTGTALVAVAVLAATSVLVSGCGASSDTAATTAAAAATAGRSARGPAGCASDIYRCTRIWFHNDSPNWVTLNANGHDQGKQSATIAPGKMGSITGYAGGWGQSDISGGVMRDDHNGQWFGFRARNPQVGKPSIGFYPYNDPDEDVTRFSEGETQSFPGPGGRVFKVTRNDDTAEYIEFSVRYVKE